MADYWCLECGRRTGMMGHGERHDKILAERIDQMVECGWERGLAVTAVGSWQIGERGEPMVHWADEILWN